MQCCTCSNWVYSKCSLLSFARVRTLGSFHSCSFPPCCVSAFFGDATSTSTVTSSSYSSSWYTSTAQSGPSGLPSANAALAPHPRLQTSYPFSAHFVSSPFASLPPPHAPGCFSLPPASSSPPLTPSGFFNGMLGVSEPGALNCYTLFRLIPLTLFVSRNLILIYLPLTGSLDSLLCDPMAPTPDPVFFLLMSQTLAAASLFSSGRAYPSLNFLLPLFLRLAPTLIM